MRKTMNFVIAGTIGFSVSICTVILYYSSVLPDSYYVSDMKSLDLSAGFPITAVSNNIEADAVVMSGGSEDIKQSDKAMLKLFGILPVKEVEVIEAETPMLIPGGMPFGIKIMTEGVMVVGMGEVNSSDGVQSPAADAGIEEGDVIISMSGEEVYSNEDIQAIISGFDGTAIEVIIERDSKRMTKELIPVYSESNNCYQAGMWVRDSSAGIGTVTFYDMSTGRFGGLGHPVCDIDTGEILPLSSGDVVDVDITGVKKGMEGMAGELQGMFISDNAAGKLYANNEYGVFGSMAPDKYAGIQALPMGMKQEIKIGEAVILTTLDGDEPKEYSIEIEKIDYRSDNYNKNMVIRVTDKELLEKTGGIVQGMSGSPIIQNGKLIGAVTHVFVNEPSKGYAIFSENMYEHGIKTE